MKVLILGGSGILGHKLWQSFASRFDSYRSYKLFASKRTIEHVSAENFDAVARAINAVRPEVVVNCIGVVKQAEAAKDQLVLSYRN